MSAATVLVVDDDAQIIYFLSVALEDRGYRVLSAESSEAVHIAGAEQPDVILLDLMMPRVAGVEVSERLRANPSTAHIPIILMSAQHNLNILRRHMPVDDCLGKPFAVEDLYAMVERWTRT